MIRNLIRCATVAALFAGFLSVSSPPAGASTRPEAAPANDAFASAQVITGASGTATGTNVDATKEDGEPDHAGNPGGASVWFTWTAPTTGTATFDTCTATNFDTLLAVYSITPDDVLTGVGANDTQSRAVFTATAGTTYHVAVDGNGGVSGGYTLTWSTAASPANDAFAGATVLTGASGTASGTNGGATKEEGEPDHAGNPGGASVWFTWTAPATGPISFDTCNATDFDTLLAVYSGSAVNGLDLIPSSDEACGSRRGLIFDAAAGTTYRVAIDGFNFGGQPAVGSFTLTWGPGPLPPANDAFAAARVLTGASGTASGTNVEATKEPGEPDHAGNPGGASVWFTWTAPATGTATVDTCTATNFNTLLAVYSGSEVNGLAPIASNDDACGSRSRMTFTATAGTIYHVAVDGYFGHSGDYSLTWSVAASPANDAFAGARVINGASGTASGTNGGATREEGEPDHAGNPGGASVWFTWTAPTTGTATFDTCTATNFNTLLAVYTGSSVGALTPVAQNDDGEACAPGSQLTFNTSAGTTYHVAVDGNFGRSGDYTLSWSLAQTPPANDAFADAAVLAGLSGSRSGTNEGATKEPGEPDHAGNPGGHSVWFTWTAPTIVPTTNVWFGTCTGDDSGIDTLLSVYSGSTLAALSPVTANDDAEGCFASSQVMVTATAGTTYRIALDGAQRSGEAASGGYTLAWGPVRNDVLIRKGTRPFIGDDIYNPAGTGQTVGASVGPGGTATFTVKVQNETATRLVQRIRGAASNRNFRITYRDPAGNDISALVAAGMQRLFAPGETYRMTVTIKAKAGTPRGATITAATRVTATGTPVTDTAMARVTRI